MTESNSGIKLSNGKPNTVINNRPLKARIKFASGTWIECVVSPNTAFTICQMGDVVDFSLTVDDECVAPLKLVE